MTRTILAVATALLAAPALFSSAAEACISCEYTPEVGRSTAPSNAAKPEPRPYVRERARAVEREPARAAKRSEPAEEKATTAEKAPAAKDASNENSSIASMAAVFDAPTATAKADSKTPSRENSSISVAFPEPAATALAKAEPKPERGENSSISVAATEVAVGDKAPIVEPAKPVAAKAADCKKFVSSVGMIVSVPCD